MYEGCHQHKIFIRSLRMFHFRRLEGNVPCITSWFQYLWDGIALYHDLKS